MPPDQPRQPAVKGGIPTAYRRCMIRSAALFAIPPALMLIAITPAMFSNTPTTVLGFPYSAIVLIAISIAVPLEVIAIIRIARFEWRVAANPGVCLHCLYPIESGTPHCPECGRLNNRQDLNQEWQQIIKQGERSSD